MQQAQVRSSSRVGFLVSSVETELEAEVRDIVAKLKFGMMRARTSTAKV